MDERTTADLCHDISQKLFVLPLKSATRATDFFQPEFVSADTRAGSNWVGVGCWAFR